MVAGQVPAVYGAHAMEFSISQPAMRRARTTGFEPVPTVLETAVLPLNYVPRVFRVKKNRPSGFPEGRLPAIA